MLGLFQRAILMSGTALSPMALSKDPREITLQVIKELNCSSENDTAISSCLKNAKLEALLNAKVRYT
jgi:carboxylesterase type B